MVIYPNKHNMEVNIALLTVTDTRTIENDKSGGILVKKIAEQKHRLVDRKIVKDNKEEIKKVMEAFPDSKITSISKVDNRNESKWNR